MNEPETKKCCDCGAWRGRCALGKLNRIARSDACEMFDPTPQGYEFRLMFPLMVSQT